MKKKYTIATAAALAVGLMAAPAAANANSSPATAYQAAAESQTSANTTRGDVQPNFLGAAVNGARALYAGFKAGTAPRQVSQYAAYGSFLASVPSPSGGSNIDLNQAFDR